MSVQFSYMIGETFEFYNYFKNTKSNLRQTTEPITRNRVTF